MPVFFWNSDRSFDSGNHRERSSLASTTMKRSLFYPGAIYLGYFILSFVENNPVILTTPYFGSLLMASVFSGLLSLVPFIYLYSLTEKNCLQNKDGHVFSKALLIAFDMLSNILLTAKLSSSIMSVYSVFSMVGAGIIPTLLGLFLLEQTVTWVVNQCVPLEEEAQDTRGRLPPLSNVM